MWNRKLLGKGIGVMTVANVVWLCGVVQEARRV